MQMYLKKIVKRIIKDIILKQIRNIRGKLLLKNRDFTIISNNCWGGSVYKYFGLEYSTPTIGVYFFAAEYIKFLKRIKDYVSMNLCFIECSKSKYYKYMLDNNFRTDIPIGLIGDVEIVFLHYKSEKEALEKWERRKKRINWDNLVIKFNDQNLCTEDLIIEFDNLNFLNKICFTSKTYRNLNSIIYFSEFSNEPNVLDDSKVKTFRKYIDITYYLNNIKKGS